MAPAPEAAAPGRLALANSPVNKLLAALLLTILLCGAWLPIYPKYLFDFDCVNFALSIDEFAPHLHQPQPPGYPLFVALLRVLRPLAPSVELTLFVAGLFGAVAAALLLWVLGERWFQPRAGLAAAVLFAVNPALWSGQITSPVRIYLAVGALGTVLLGWSAWQHRRTNPHRYSHLLYATALFLGLAAGFRPTNAIHFLPLVGVVALGSSRRWRDWPCAAACFGLGVVVWLVPTIAAAGGIAKFTTVLQEYLAEQSRKYSSLYGASTDMALTMVRRATIWTGLGALSWAWAVPVALWRRGRGPWHYTGWLLLWCLPSLLFDALVHIEAPSQALATVPAVCLLGGWALAGLPGRHADVRGQVIFSLGLLVAAALNVWWFYKPFHPDVRESSYVLIKRVNESTQLAIDRLRALKTQGPLAVIAFESPLSWRMLMYYFPDVPVIVPREHPDRAGSPAPYWFARDRHAGQPKPLPAVIPLPACGTVAWFLPWESDLSHRVRDQFQARKNELVQEMAAVPGRAFSLGNYHFAHAPGPCE